jgi:hypothetical protein
MIGESECILVNRNLVIEPRSNLKLAATAAGIGCGTIFTVTGTNFTLRFGRASARLLIGHTVNLW